MRTRWRQPVWWTVAGYFVALALADTIVHLTSFGIPAVLPLGEELALSAGLLGTALWAGIPTPTALITVSGLTALWLMARGGPTGLAPAVVGIVAAILIARRRTGLIRLGHRWLFVLPTELTTDDRFLHTHVIGPTGSGKSSSVLMPLLAQDLAAGRPVALIEPKGDLSYTAYRTALQHGHTVVYFDPLLPDCPRYNPLAGPADTAAEGLSLALDQLSEAGHPFYAVTARVQLLYSVMAVKSAYKDETDLTHLLDFLRQDHTHRAVLAQVDDPRIVAYFRDQLGTLSRKTVHEQRQGLLNRLELLLVNPHVRRALTGPGDFDWDRALAAAMTVICPLSPAELGQSARTLGIILWHGLASATYRRSLDGNRPYFLYLDEFHQYVTPDLGDFLALARGYKMGLILAHQDLGQLPPSLQAAVLANARHRIMLGGLSADDARVFAALAQPHVLPDRLRYLPRGRAYVQLTQKGRLRPPHHLFLPYHALGDRPR